MLNKFFNPDGSIVNVTALFNGANKLLLLDETGKLPAVDGSQLTNLPSGGTTASYQLNFDTSTTAADPGNNNFRADNATPASITNLYLDDLAISGIDLGSLYSKIDVDTIIYFVQGDDNSKGVILKATGSATDNTGWWTVPVVHQDGGTLPDNGAVCNLEIEISGIGITEVVQDTTPQLGGQLDINGFALGNGTEEFLKFSEAGSAVNEVTITNAATGNAPTLSATGDDADIDLELAGKGTGKPTIGGNAVATTNDITGGLTPVPVAFGDSPYTASAGELLILDASGGAITINLPASGSDAIIDVAGDFSTNNLTLDAAGADTVNGSATKVLAGASHYERVAIDSTQTDWTSRTLNAPTGNTPAEASITVTTPGASASITAGTPLINGSTWTDTTGATKTDFTTTTGGRATFSRSGASSIPFQIIANPVGSAGTGNVDVLWYVAKNGTVITDSKNNPYNTGTNNQGGFIIAEVSLDETDYVEIFQDISAGTDTVTLESCTFSIQEKATTINGAGATGGGGGGGISEYTYEASPTVSTMTSNATWEMWWRLKAPKTLELLIKCIWAGGTTGSNPAVTLPNSYTANTTIFYTAGRTFVGRGGICRDSSSPTFFQTFDLIPVIRSSGVLEIYRASIDGDIRTADFNNTAPITIAANDTLFVRAEIEIN